MHEKEREVHNTLPSRTVWRNGRNSIHPHDSKYMYILVLSAQLILYNMKAGLITTKNSVKKALQTGKSDIIRDVLWVIRKIPINIHFEHVYGHQDNSFHSNELPQINQLNVICEDMENRSSINGYQTE